MRSRKCLPLVTAATSVFSQAVAAQDAGAGTGGALYANQEPQLSQIWDELDDTSKTTVGTVDYYWSYDTEVADDFVVPEGDGWSIERVFVSGQKWNVGGPFDPKLTFAVHADDNGLPGAVVADAKCSAAGVTPVLTTPTDPDYSDAITPADLSYELSAPCYLVPGHYWLSIAADDPQTGFFYANVTKKPVGAPASDYTLAVRTACDQGSPVVAPALPPDFQSLPVACTQFDAGTPYLATAPFDDPKSRPTDLADVNLDFALYGVVGLAPAEPDGGADAAAADGGTDAAAVDGGTDAAVPDASAGHADGGLDAGAMDSGATRDGGVAGDGDVSGDGGVAGDGDSTSLDASTAGGNGGGSANNLDGGLSDVKLTAKGGGCSTTPTPGSSFHLFALAGLAIAYVRRRKVHITNDATRQR